MHSETNLTQPTFEQLDASSKYTFYVLVREDISFAQQVVQSAHAAAEAARRHYKTNHGIASTVVLRVRDKAALLKAHARLGRDSVEHELFYEPDFDMGYSALATRPLSLDERRLMRHWQVLGNPCTAPTELQEKGGL